MEVHAHTHTARKKWTHYFWSRLRRDHVIPCSVLWVSCREYPGAPGRA